MHIGLKNTFYPDTLQKEHFHDSGIMPVQLKSKSIKKAVKTVFFFKNQKIKIV